MAVLILLVAAAAPALGQPPHTWQERYELTLPSTTLAPTSVDRLASAEVLVVKQDDLFWDGSQWNLIVNPWIYWNGEPYDNGGCDTGDGPNSTLPICDPSAPIHDQPTPGAGACSGVLVAPDKVVTAGHCFSSGGGKPPWTCSDRYVIFDFAYLSSGHILENPPGSGLVPLAPEQLVQCLEVTVDTDERATTSEEGLLLPPSGNGDWSLWQLDGTAPSGYVPIPLDRFFESSPGDPALVLHHPARIPLKGEVTTLGGAVNVDILPLGGTSGSPVINLETGRLAGILGSGPWGAWGTVDCSEPCVTLEYDHPPLTAGGTPAQNMVLDVPRIGLQLEEQMPQRTVAEFYGPPTTPADFPTWTATLSVPEDSFPLEQDFPLAWEAKQDDSGDAWFEVTSAATSGTLWDDGTEETVETGPTSLLTSFDPDVYEKTFGYFDYLYGTRTEVIHRAYVGVEGFQKWPSGDLDGEGPGVPETTTQLYTVANRWIVGQDVTVKASDPSVPGEPWPSWLLLNQNTYPVTLGLLPEGTGFPGYVSLGFNASGLTPDVYTAMLSFESEDSGTPAYTEELEVRLDACRRVAADSGAPQINILPGGAPYERTFTVGAYPQNVIHDVDVAFVTSLPNIGGQGNFTVTLTPPDPLFPPITLKNENTSLPEGPIWDDETDAPFDPLSTFDGSNSAGPWVLRIHNTGTVLLSGDLERFEIRLHHDSQPPCVQ